jgi:predicted RNA-binding Zn ribbon-like protein
MEWRGSDRPLETLNSYLDLIRWGLEHWAIEKSTFISLANKSKIDQRKANLALKKARNLREIIYRIFSASSHGKRPRARDLVHINQIVSKALSNLELNFSNGKTKNNVLFVWSWKDGDKDDLDRILWPIAKSAADLLVSDRLRFVRECANEKEGCGWLFIDASKNHSRKWCSMSSCGNRSKVRSYYERHSSLG